jgi:hypothetical protein
MVPRTCNPVTPKADIGGLQSQADTGESMRPYLKKKPKAKGLWEYRSSGRGLA